jgi:hypothetical protein
VRPLTARLLAAGLLAAALLMTAVGCKPGFGEGAGPLAAGEPVQEAVSRAGLKYAGDWKVQPVARFAVDALVLGRERYFLDHGASLSPVDLALGWGPMSDPAVVNQVSVSQARRFYFWRVSRYPIPRQAIISHSANMHMIPADDDVRSDLLDVRRGDVVRIEGFLVNAVSEDGGRWSSSLTRTDSGNGACELVWVERVTVR